MKTARAFSALLFTALALGQDSEAKVQFEKSSYLVNRNEGGSALIAVTRKGSARGEASVSYTSKGGSAKPDSDYVSAGDKLIFAGSETRKTFAVPILESSAEGDKTIGLELTDPENAALGSPAKAVLTIASKRSLLDPTTSRVLRHLGLIASILGFLMLLGIAAVKQARTAAGEWTADFVIGKELLFPPERTTIQPEHRARLTSQFTEVGKRIEHHVEVMVYFYAAYYMSIVTFSVAAALAAVALVLVSKQGWDSANEYIATIFFTTTAASAFFGSFPAVFQQQQNISDNKELALKFLALQNEIVTYAVTGEALSYDAPAADRKAPLGIASTPAEFLHYVDLKVSRDNIAIGFDVKQVANYKAALEK